MDSYSFFDIFIDAVFVLDREGKIIYCNDPAANLCQTSVRRLVGKAFLSDLIDFSEPVFPFDESSKGWNESSPLFETEYSLKKVRKSGKVQLAIHPMSENNPGTWVFVIHDVSLEEVLHGKYRSELTQKEGYISQLEKARQKLEEHSKNLEQIVEERTQELRKTNVSLSAVLNSLGQGFLTFDRNGICGRIYTRATVHLLGKEPSGHSVCEVLAVTEAQKEQFKMWLQALFSEALPFEDLKPLGPNLFQNSEERYISLDYFPVRDESRKIVEIVVVATDRTGERKAQLDLEQERQYAAMVVKFVKNKDQFLRFLMSLEKSLKLLTDGARVRLDFERVKEDFRSLHTIEGEAGTFSLYEFRMTARECQRILEPFKKGDLKMDEISHRRYLEAIHSFDRGFKKFVDDNAHLFQMPESNVGRHVEVPAQSLLDFSRCLARQHVDSKVIEDFQNRFLKEPVGKRLTYFEGLVQDVAQKLGKKIAPLKIVGGQERIYPEPYNDLFASLVHVFRNAVDHGIESPEERTWAGKSEEGDIQIHFSPLKSGGFRLTIQDDGQGIDPEALREKLSRLFPEQAFGTQSDEEVIQNIFKPGFSSKEAVGEFSGRGVGMDAVHEEVVKLGGAVKAYSKVGKGTRIEIEIPGDSDSAKWLRSA